MAAATPPPTKAPQRTRHRQIVAPFGGSTGREVVGANAVVAPSWAASRGAVALSFTSLLSFPLLLLLLPPPHWGGHWAAAPAACHALVLIAADPRVVQARRAADGDRQHRAKDTAAAGAAGAFQLRSMGEEVQVVPALQGNDVEVAASSSSSEVEIGSTTAAEENGSSSRSGSGSGGGSQVVVATATTLPPLLRRQRFALVNFYAPWCGHSQELMPEFAAAAARVRRLRHADDVVLAQVDADRWSDFAKGFGVDGYPTLLWFERGQQQQDYNSGRTADEIVFWVRNKIAAGELPSKEEDGGEGKRAKTEGVEGREEEQEAEMEEDEGGGLSTRMAVVLSTSTYLGRAVFLPLAMLLLVVFPVVRWLRGTSQSPSRRPMAKFDSAKFMKK